MKTGFYEIFKPLPAQTQDDFAAYVAFVESGDTCIVRTFRYAQALLPSGAVPDEETLHQHLYQRPSVTLRDRQKVQNHLGELKKHLLQFLAKQEVAHNWDRPEVQWLTLSALRRHQLPEAYANQFDKVRSDAKKTSHQTLWDDWMQLRLAHEHYFTSREDDWSADRGGDLTEVIGHLQRFYGAMRLTYGAERLSRQAMLGETAVDIDPEALLAFANGLEQPEAGSLHLRREIFALLHTEDAAIFERLRDRFLQHPPTDQEEALALLMYLVNYASRRINNGERAYIAAAFELYQTGLERRLLSMNGFFPVGPFHNILNIACGLGHFTWAEAFIQESGAQLMPKFRKENIQWAKARLLFAQGSFEGVVFLLRDLPHANLSIGIQARLLLIRAHYELDASASKVLHPQCDNLYAFIHRHKTLGVRYRDGALAFGQVLRALLNGKPRKTLESMVEQSPAPSCQEWLRSKIMALPDDN